MALASLRNILLAARKGRELVYVGTRRTGFACKTATDLLKALRPLVVGKATIKLRLPDMTSSITASKRPPR